MSNLLEWVLEEDLEIDRITLKSVLEYFKQHSEEPCRLLETQEGYHTLTFVCLFAYCHRQSLEDEDIDKVLLQKDVKLYECFWVIFKQLFDTRNDWIHAANRQFDPEEIREDTTLEERKQFVFCSYLQLFMSLLPISNEFYALSNKGETISVLVGIVADEHFLEKLDEFTLDVLIINISNLSNYADSIKSDWLQLKCVPVLLHFLSKHPSFYIFIYETVLNVASEKEIQELGNINEIFSKFLSIFHCNDFSETHREKYFDDEFTYVETEVGALYYEEKECTIAITDFMRVLYRLSVNDSIKLSFYTQIKDILKSLILKTHNEVVRQYAVQILTQLSFNKQVLEDVIKEKELVECISRLSKDESILWKRLIKNCQQILWLIQNHSNNNQIEKVKNLYEFDFMISYNSENRDLCLRVKRSLEANSFKVWMNVDQIHGSSVESMAKIVESSKCVLICVTEKYKQCISCRCEAEYANKNNQWLIPLIMQRGYDQVDGWLGLIKGSKVSIDFCTTEYEKAFEELMRNINLNIKALKTEEPIKANTSDVSSQSPTSSDFQATISTTKIPTEQSPTEETKNSKTKFDEIESWTPTQVDDWLASQNTHESIREYLRPCNGELLIQLHQLQIYSPQYFFQIISNIKGLSDPLSYLNFGISLNRLLNRKKIH